MYSAAMRGIDCSSWPGCPAERPLRIQSKKATRPSREAELLQCSHLAVPKVSPKLIMRLPVHAAAGHTQAAQQPWTALNVSC